MEVGCGAGNHLLFFKDLGVDIYGIDASGYMIDKARSQLGNICTLMTGWAEDLPFEDNEFDLVMLINTLEFVEDPEKAIQEAGRVSRRWIFIGFVNSLSWFAICWKIRNFFQRNIFSGARFFNLWEMKGYLQRLLGPVDIRWNCNMLWPSVFKRIGVYMDDSFNIIHCPFGSFMGITVTLSYKMRTEGLSLSVGIKKTTESIVGGLTINYLFERSSKN
jgi:SAM-dependent methyltransferase